MTTDNILNGSIEAVDIATDAVNRAHIQDGAITNAKVIDGFSLLPAGAIILWAGANCPPGYDRFTALDNRFPLGSNVPMVEGGTSTISGLTMSTTGQHSHTVNSHTHSIGLEAAHQHAGPWLLSIGGVAAFMPGDTEYDHRPARGPFGVRPVGNSIANPSAVYSSPSYTARATDDMGYALTSQDGAHSHGGVTGSTSPGTDQQGNHKHEITSDGTWKEPYLTILFCQKQ